MAGARSLAMALNRLIDREIDARNPRTASRELPSGALQTWQVLAFCVVSLAVFLVAVFQLAHIVALALADPGRRLRRLPVSQARHVALSPLARGRGRARAGRRLGRDHGRAAVAGVDARRRGRALDRGLRPLLRALRPGASTAQRGCIRARRGSACAAASRARGSSTSLTVALLVRAGLGLAVGRLLLGRRHRRRGAARCTSTDRAPGDLRRLDAAFFTDERRDQRRVLRVRDRGRGRVIRRAALGEALRRASACSRDVDLELRRGGSSLVTGPNGSGKTTLLRLCAGLARTDRGAN